MNAPKPSYELAIVDPELYIWYRFKGTQAKITMKDGTKLSLSRGDEFGLRQIGSEYHFFMKLENQEFRCRISPVLYVQLLDSSVAIKEHNLDYPTVERRIRLCQRAFKPHLLLMISKLGSNGTRSLEYLRVLASTLYALMHCYGIALTTVKRPVSTLIVHDPFVAKMHAFLTEGISVNEIPKSKLNGFQLVGVVAPKSHAVRMDLEARLMFAEGKVLLERLIKSRIPLEITTLIVNESPQPMIRCNLIARELVLLCAVMSELLNGNTPQARFNAQSLRLVRFTRN